MSNNDKPKATVFGAGIAGLTVAHELIERGWEVEVYEKEPEPHSYTACAVGGMARTQWGRIDTALAPDTRPPWLEAKAATGGLQLPEDVRFEFDDGGWELKLTPAASTALASLIAKLADGVASFHIIEVRGFASQLEAFSDERRLEDLWMAVPDVADGEVSDAAIEEARVYYAARRPDLLLSQLRALVVRRILTNAIIADDKDKVFVLHLAMGEVDDTLARTEPDAAHNYVGINELRRPFLPGEHGYRYFPSFYQNVFDTMSRIRILEPRRPTEGDRQRIAALKRLFGRTLGVPNEALPYAYTDTGRTVYDNLVSNDGFEIAGADCRAPVYLDRTDAESLYGLLAVTRDVLERRGSELSDLLRFQLRLAVYLTSGGKRRRTYEDLTWEEFLHADRCSEGFRTKLEAFPKALVGLSSSKADARSMGTVTVQLLLDQLRETRLRDASLNGPTSVAWLDPWKRYLEERRVKFHRGCLVKLRVDATKKRVALEPWVKLDCNEDIEPLPSPGYLVVAVPLKQAKGFCKDLYRALPPKEKRRRSSRDIRRIAKFRTRSALTDFTGVQFYLNSPLFAGVSHTYYQDADWGLSSIMQSNLWADQRAYRGEDNQQLSVLSVDVTELAGARGLDKKTFVASVWEQVSAGLSNFGWEPEDPYAWHVDDGLVFGPNRAVVNKTPYLVNLAGEWRRRPGRLRSSLRRPGYDVQIGKLIFAGSYMTTHTRITTMESANEAGRHAVNGLLRRHGYRIRIDRSRATRKLKIRRTEMPKLRAGRKHGRADQGFLGGRQLAARQRAIADGVLANYASIHDPESNEPPDLHWLKALDDRLCALNMPHLFEILELEAWIDAAEPDPAALMDVLHRLSTLGLDPSTSLPQLLSSLWSAWRGLRR